MDMGVHVTLLSGFFLLSLTLLEAEAAFPWASAERAEPQVSFFDLVDLKVGVAPRAGAGQRQKEARPYGSEKWKRVQEGTAQRARGAGAAGVGLRKYFGLFQTERSVVRSGPPCLARQKIDRLGLCRTEMLFTF